MPKIDVYDIEGKTPPITKDTIIRTASLILSVFII